MAGCRFSGFILFAVLCICVLSFHANSRADGGFYPEAAYEMPDLPVQMALISFKDAIETLVVESTITGRGRKFSWILPVPGNAISIKPGTAGLMKTMAVQLIPEMRDPSPLVYLAVLALPFLYLLCLPRAVDAEKRMVGKIILAIVLVLFLILLLVPNFYSYRGGGGSATTMEGIQIVNADRVGSYNTIELKADNPDILRNWLRENGFREFDSGAEEIVAHYIRKGWHFIVSSLVSGGSDFVKPHPLEITFATPMPVYPMRLTAIHGGTLYLDLFVVADSAVTAEPYDLEVLFQDRFYPMDKGAAELLSMGREGFRDSRENPSKSTAIAHPDAQRLMWPSCCVTRLRGEIDADSMNDDIWFDMADITQRKVPRWFSHEAAFWVGMCWVDLFLILTFAVFGRPDIKRKALTVRRWAFYAGTSVIILLILLVNYWAIGDKLRARKISRYHWDQIAAESYNDLLNVFSMPPSIHYTDDEFIEAFRQLKNGNATNPFTGQPIVVEDSPGNISIERRDGVIYNAYIHHKSGARYE